MGGSGFKDKYNFHTNALIVAGDTLYTSSGRDTTVAGAHLEGDRVWMDVGRDLTVASLQDQYDSKNYSWSAGADVTVGYGVMVGGNVGFGQGKTESDWVGQQTSIVGRSEVDIYVENNTHIKGAIIATDPGGDLTLNTNTLTYEEIKDKNKGYDWSLSVSGSTSIGGGGFEQGKEGDTFKPYDYTSKPNDNKNNSGENKGSATDYVPSNISGHYSSHDKEGILRPTVTEGEIIVRSNPDAETDGSLDGLNRDIGKAREITKDEEAYTDIYVSPAAVEEILKGFPTIISQVKEIPKQLEQLANTLQAAVATLPPDLKHLGEAGLDSMKNMLANGVDPEIAKEIMRDPEFQKLLGSFSNLNQSFAEQQNLSQPMGNGKDNYRLDPETGKKILIVRSVTLNQTVGTYTYDLLADLSNYINSIASPEKRAAVMFGIQIALGGPVKTALAAVKDAIVNSVAGDFKEYVVNNAYAYLKYGEGHDEHLASISETAGLNYNDSLAENRAPVELGLSIVGIIGGATIKKIANSGTGQHLVGSNGVHLDGSKTLWLGEKGAHLDVENFDPGVRLGQVHYQDKNGKYYYDIATKSFPDAPRYVNDMLKNDSKFQSAVHKAVTRYLGEKH